jgi:hypothetical protein
MAINLANSEPKAGAAKARKPARLRPFSAPSLGQCWPGHWPGQPGPNPAQHGPFVWPPQPTFCPPASALGQPLGIGQAAQLIGCSPWTVRQTLIPRGLPRRIAPVLPAVAAGAFPRRVDRPTHIEPPPQRSPSVVQQSCRLHMPWRHPSARSGKRNSNTGGRSWWCSPAPSTGRTRRTPAFPPVHGSVQESVKSSV